MLMQCKDDQVLDHPFSSAMTRKQKIVINLNKDTWKGHQCALDFVTYLERPSVRVCDWLPVKELIRYDRLVMTHKILHGNCPDNLQNKFMRRSQISSYSTIAKISICLNLDWNLPKRVSNLPEPRYGTRSRNSTETYPL